MFDLDRDVKVCAGGREWTLGKWTVGMMLDFRDWVGEVVGDPFEVLDRYIDKLAPEEAARQLEEAKSIRKQLRNFTLECPLAREVLSQSSGALKLLHLRLLARRPEATPDDAFAVAVALAAQIAAVKAKAPEEGAEAGNPPPPPG